MKAMYVLFAIVAVIAIIVLVLIAAEARRAESCVCYYVGDCVLDEEGKPYRYMQCTGSCYAYSRWVYEPRCLQEGYPKRLLE